MEQALAHFLSKFTYLAIVAVLSAAGLGLPISEDLTLLLAGGLAARGVTDYWPTLVSGYCGVVLGDVLIQHWGRRLGPAAWQHRLVLKHLPLSRQEKLWRHFNRHGFLTIVVARHTPVLRAPIFFLAGAAKLPLWKFLLADGLSAAITVPLVTTLGFYFGEHLDEIRGALRQFEWAIAALAALAVLGWLLWRRRRRIKADSSGPRIR